MSYAAFNMFIGHGYHWKGLYHESMQEALFRGFKCRSRDMHSVSIFSFIGFVTILQKFIVSIENGQLDNKVV